MSNEKKDFINKWSNWWDLTKQGKELTIAFERELDALTDQQTALLQSRIKELEDELRQYKPKLPFEDYNKCGKCEMLGDSAPCDECYRKTLKFPTP